MEQTRKARRDKGARLMTPRDQQTLSWIAEQYAVRFDHLRKLLSRESGHTPPTQAPGPQGVAASTAQHVLTRWQQDPAWVEYQRFQRGSGWIAVSPYGLQVIDLPYSRHTLRETRIAHIHAMNRVRLDIEARHPEWQWTSERTLRLQSTPREAGSKVPHTPDAEVWLSEQQCVAVEAELSPKPDSETGEIITELLSRYANVWYFVSEASPVEKQAKRVVKKMVSALPDAEKSRVQVIPLEKLSP